MKTRFGCVDRQISLINIIFQGKISKTVPALSCLQQPLSSHIAFHLLVWPWNFWLSVFMIPAWVTELLKMIILRKTLKEYSYLHNPTMLHQVKTKSSPVQAQKREIPWLMCVSCVSSFRKPEVKSLRSKLWSPS